MSAVNCAHDWEIIKLQMLSILIAVLLLSGSVYLEINSQFGIINMLKLIK